MKLSFLLLSALLALSSASLLDIVKQSSEHRNGSLLNPDPKQRVPETADRNGSLPKPDQKHRVPQTADRNGSLPKPDPKHRVPKITDNMSVPSPSPAVVFRQKRETTFHSYGKLKWQTWSGYLPSGAVSSYNKYVGRLDYICKNGCNSGFYNPDKGPYCHNPFKSEEYVSSDFEILVNEDNFEMLEWKKDSDGSVPPNSIRTCTSDELYVGRHKYGLGKVHPAHKCFYLPWEGDEYWYRSYEVLTIKRDVSRESVSKVQYNINGGDTLTYPPHTMQTSIATNRECQSVLKKVELSTKSTTESSWDISTSLFFSRTVSMNAGIPNIFSAGIESTTEFSTQSSSGKRYSKEITHSVSLELTVPPNHNCKVRMVGRRHVKDIPFTATLTRTYITGETISAPISGMYKGIAVGDIMSDIDPCVPVTNPTPCP